MAEQEQRQPESRPAGQQLMEQTLQSWEQAISSYMDGLLNNAPWAAGAGKAVEGSLQLRQQFDRLTAATIAGMNLPTKADLDRVLYRLNQIEGVLNDISAKLDRLAEDQA